MDRFTNLDGSSVDKGFGDVLKWKLGPKEGGSRPAGNARPTPFVANDGRALARAERPSLTWIGHATFLVQLGGRSFLIDPIYSTRLFTLKRSVAPGVPMGLLPPIDGILVTHNHRDHMDAPTLRALSRSGPGGASPVHVVAMGDGPNVRREGADKIVELGWWQSVDIGGVRVSLVPSQHWSQRGLRDRNRSLWGGYVLEADGLRVYHSGDTAYFDGFHEIGKRFGKIDAAMLPIGAYEPRWFMRGQHMNPTDAVQAFLDLGAEKLVAMHWGTFRLTDEPLDEPPLALEEVLTQRRLTDPGVFRVPAIGETLWLDRASQTRRT